MIRERKRNVVLFYLPCDSHHSAWHESDVFFLRGEESCVGTSVEEWDTKPLGSPNGDVHAKLPGWLQDRQGKKIGGTNCQGLRRKKIQLPSTESPVMHLKLSN